MNADLGQLASTPASYRGLVAEVDEPAAHLRDDDLFFSACQSAFWEIDVVRASSWNGHIPFMFMVFQLVRPRRYVELGCHDGGSLFAACQARARLGLDTECVAIDTWSGDPHSGFYGPEVLQNLVRDLSVHGYDDALLEQARFDDAVHKFEDESIDVLLIDGLHTYEAVKHDLETWLPKVVPGGLVMLHDTQVHERDFGVWRLWQEISGRYDSWEFLHSHGLGVLIKEGPESPVRQFVRKLAEDRLAAAHLQSLIETVAERSISHNQLRPANERASIWHNRACELEAELQTSRCATEEAADRLRALQDEVDSHELALEKARGAGDEERAANERERADLARQLESLRAELGSLRDEQARTVSHYEGMKAMRLAHFYWASRNRIRRLVRPG